MNIDQVIKVLLAYKKNFGNVKVVMSSDPEGNGYATLHPQWSFTSVHEGEDDFIDEMIKQRRIKGTSLEEIEFQKKAKVVGVCLYPYIENIETAEKAVHTDSI